jgi:hypothetical protein
MLRISLADGSFRTGGHPFFKPLGENRRACVTCHQPSNAMSLPVLIFYHSGMGIVVPPQIYYKRLTQGKT